MTTEGSRDCCRARKMTDEQRSAVASYLSIYRGSEGGAAKLALSQVSAANHPSIERALRLLDAAWTEVRLCRRSFKSRGAGYMLIYLSKDGMRLPRWLSTRQLP